MNLTITQDNTRTETINSSIIDKLYEIAFAASSDPNSTVSLTGRLESPKGYKYKMDWLNTEFGPDLTITVPTSGQYIYFEDDAVLSALVSAGVSSDGVGISADDLLVPTNLSQLGLSGNSNISSFTELSKFVNIRNNSTNFDGCTNLEWISLPNNDGNLNISFFISGGKKLKWVVPSVEFACSKEFNSWYNNPARGGGADTAWQLYDLNKQPITDVVIPNGVTSIGKYVFGKMSCNSISIPQTITNIKQCTFENVNTTQPLSLNLPNLLSLLESAFSGSNVTSITDLGSITSIPKRTFQNCTALTSVTLPSNCTSIDNSAFGGCTSLTSIDLSNVTSIGEAAFQNCSSLSGTLNLQSLTTLGKSAFQNCTSITSIANLGNINTIPETCFCGCSNLTSVIFPTTIRTFNNSCFSGCKIGQIILPYGYIGNGGWTAVMRSSVGETCRYLQYPSTTQVVGTNDMFRDSGNAINCLIIVQATTPPTTGYDPNNTGGFGVGFSWGRPGEASWYVPDSVVNDYKSTTGWDQFANKIYPISQLQIDSPTYWQVYQANKDYGVPAQS